MPIQVNTPEGSAKRQVSTDDAAAGGNPLAGITLAQALTWITNNVTNLASAQTALKHIVRVVWSNNARIADLEKQIKQLKG